ncbi:MAG TPA: cytochrome C oxidase subunit IV family protein, partial [Actinomycetota bacterium]|nr:cytochrome C oxidase subunit IV family protein [Actinomycetota bacterium]
ERQVVEPTDGHAAAGAHAAGHPSPKEYVRIGLILGALTALEIAASYAGVSGSILIPTLFILAVIKFALVVLWFMHLKFDDRRYARFFVMGLSGAAVLYLVVLISFRVFL